MCAAFVTHDVKHWTLERRVCDATSGSVKPGFACAVCAAALLPVRSLFTALYDYPKYGTPFKRGGEPDTT